MIWQLNGTDTQNRIISEVLGTTTFPFGVLEKGLFEQTGRKYIPVEWADLSSVALSAEVDVLEVRDRVLGLAWYSGKVSLDLSLERNPTLAQEVFLAEGAHMLDFFWMSDRERMVVWNALHPEAEDLPLDTDVVDGLPIAADEGWFDVGDYRSWVGEAWMGLFVAAYSNLSSTIAFNRNPTVNGVNYTVRNLTPFFTSKRSVVYHDSHSGVSVANRFVTRPTRIRPCGVCKP